MSDQPGEDYFPLTVETIVDYLARHKTVAAILGGDPEDWSVSEIGDGNLNLVFHVESTTAAIIAKQALPYIRARGEDFPLPLSRAYFEYEALLRQSNRAPGATPSTILFDSKLALTVMEFLAPHIILRKGLVRGLLYPRLAEDMGKFLARTLFRGSQFSMNEAELNADIAMFAGNSALCDVTNARVFTEPYCNAVLNRWTSPQLDETVTRIRSDDEFKHGIAEMKRIYKSKPQSLLHGDLHSGSVMVTEDNTRVIDPEFAFYGPMGFDVGALLANLLIAYIVQPAHASDTDDRKNYASWILETIEGVWSNFVEEFTHLWHSEQIETAENEGALSLLLAEILEDSLGFSAAKMTRRVIGAAHVEDLESIANTDERAIYEKKVLTVARTLLLERKELTRIDAVTAVARNAR